MPYSAMPAAYRAGCALLLAALLAPGVAHAQSDSGEEASSKTWTVDTILRQASLRGVDIAPDGNRVLWTKRYPDEEEDAYESELYLTYVDDPHGGDDPATVRLTRTGNNRAPQWSPDGERIAFLSSRAGPDDEDPGRQLWLLDPRGGAPRQLTTLENGPRDVAWLDGERLLFSAREKPTHHEEALKERKDDTRVIEDSTLYHPVRLFTVHAATGEVQRVTRNDARITEFAPSPDGRYVVYSVDPSIVDADAREQPKQYLLDRQAGTTTEIFDEQYFDPSGFTWTRDGAGFYASDTKSSDPEHEGAGIELLYYFDAADRSYEQVPLDWPLGLGYGGYAVTEKGLHVQLADSTQMRPRFYRRTADGWTHEPVDDERFRHSTAIAVGPDGETVVFGTSRAATRPSYHVGTYDAGQVAGTEELVQLNGFLDQYPMPRAKVVEWTGANGERVNGVLFYPMNYEEGRRYPLVTTIHGGPSSVDLNAWEVDWTNMAPLWAQRGAFVFRPNYHGSSQHGLDFVESIKGKYYELEIPDIVRGIDALADRGLVDKDSLGVMGWSNGAILAIQLTVEHPDLFQVAAPGAGDVNWISDYGNCAFGVSFDNSYFKGPPWEHLDHYIEKSPLFEMEKVETPTLIHFGTEDRAVPAEQGWQHYRALQQIGNAPVRYLRYPGEPHGLRRLSHQRRKMQEDLKWFDTYLFGTTSMEERVDGRVVADQAPLTRLERRQAIARTDDGHYGQQTGGTLVPETVTLGDTLTVGRFEVTRAQYRAFRASYSAAPGTADYPVSGITADAAQAYVEWLSEETGATYRLPTVAEAKALRRHAGTSENTIAYWAGYTPTPDEAQRLRPQLARHDANALLMEVGERPPGMPSPADPDADAPLLFDLDGNVAEWAVADDGSTQAVGSSAVTRYDPKAETQAPPPAAFIGFRVVRE